MFEQAGIRKAAAIAALAVAACYANHFGNSFHFDDSHAVVQNPYIRSLANIPRFFTDATTFSTLPANRTWRPLVSTSLAIDYWMGGGLKPLWFHVSTFLWYLAQLAVMFGLFRRILRWAEDAWWVDYAALFATAWYGVHPAMAETVNYIIQRGDLYSTLGVVASVAVYAAFPERRKYGLYLIPAALGMLAKPPAAILPALVFAYTFLFEEDAELRKLRAAAVRAVPALITVAILMGIEIRMTPASYAPGMVSAHDYILTQPFVALHYFLCFFAPVTLTADTDMTAFSGWNASVLSGFAFLGLLGWTIWFTARRRATRPISFGLAWFLLSLAPTALFPLSEVENDHRMFMPFVGLALAVTWSVVLALRSRVRVNRVYAAMAATLVIGMYGQGAWRRNHVWKNEETLWRDVTVKSPRNGRGLMNYGLTLMAKGETPAALDYFERAAHYTPNYYILEINTAIAHGALGHDAEAQAHFVRAISLAPGDAQPGFYFGRWLHGKGRNEEAAAQLEASIAKNPDYLDSRYELMKVYADEGKGDELHALARNTMALVPGDAVAARFAIMPVCVGSAKPASIVAARQTPEELLNRSLEYNRAGRYRDSIQTAELALRQRPDFAEAWNNIAAGHEALAEWDEAIQAAAKAVALRPDFQLARNNLAWSMQQKAAKRVALVATR